MRSLSLGPPTVTYSHLASPLRSAGLANRIVGLDGDMSAPIHLSEASHRTQAHLLNEIVRLPFPFPSLDQHPRGIIAARTACHPCVKRAILTSPMRG